MEPRVAWACRDHVNTLLTCLSKHNRVSSDTTNASTIVSHRFCDMRRDQFQSNPCIVSRLGSFKKLLYSLIILSDNRLQTPPLTGSLFQASEQV
ncbi:hypothetical protein M378DRAFT_159487, partial [Amanita muscaria Koide BX008]